MNFLSQDNRSINILYGMRDKHDLDNLLPVLSKQYHVWLLHASLFSPHRTNKIVGGHHLLLILAGENESLRSQPDGFP